MRDGYHADVFTRLCVNSFPRGIVDFFCLLSCKVRSKFGKWNWILIGPYCLKVSINFWKVKVNYTRKHFNSWRCRPISLCYHKNVDHFSSMKSCFLWSSSTRTVFPSSRTFPLNYPSIRFPRPICTPTSPTFSFGHDHQTLFEINIHHPFSAQS